MSESELYGVWYVDQDGERNAIQFSKNDNGKNVFIWAVYDIENDEIISTSKGFYYISGDDIKLDYFDSDIELDLKFALDGDKLTLSNEYATFTVTKFVLD